MNLSTSFRPENSFGLLLIGPPLSGKTSVAMQFAKPYIISTDHKIQNAVSRIPAGKEWFYDYVDVDNGKPVPYEQQWTRATQLLKAGCTDPNVQTVIWDNLSDLSGMLQAHVIANGGTKLIVGGEKVFEMQHWQPFKLLMQRAISFARGSGKMFIVCCHEDTEKDEVTGVLTYKPLVPGQLRGQLGGMFTDVWRCEVTTNPGKPPTYFVRTSPTPRMALGNSLGLPQEFVFTWDEFQKHMNNFAPPVGVEKQP